MAGGRPKGSGDGITAELWLVWYLAVNGETPLRRIIADAEKDGIKSYSIKGAKNLVGAEARYTDGTTYWHLPLDETRPRGLDEFLAGS